VRDDYYEHELTMCSKNPNREVSMDNCLEKIISKINNKEIVVGTHVHLLEHSITEMMGDVGFDFVWVDMEHTALDKEAVQNHIISCRASGTAAFIRIPWNDPVLVKPILDMHPAAVIFPFIMNAEDAERAIASCKYPPRGRRGFGPKRANDYGIMSIEDYVVSADSSIWVILQIEHIEAVKQLDEILLVKGIDSVVVGPNDLAASLGLIGQTSHTKVKKAMDEIASVVLDHKKPLGVSIDYNPGQIEEWLKRGVSWLGVGTDLGYIVAGAQNALSGTEKLIRSFS
jgi:2-keto-3-deoxy-L-rhamnonate aldolase RhmA